MTHLLLGSVARCWVPAADSPNRSGLKGDQGHRGNLPRRDGRNLPHLDAWVSHSLEDSQTRRRVTRVGIVRELDDEQETDLRIAVTLALAEYALNGLMDMQRSGTTPAGVRFHRPRLLGSEDASSQQRPLQLKERCRPGGNPSTSVARPHRVRFHSPTVPLSNALGGPH